MASKQEQQRVEDAALCSSCGGRCCKQLPGRFKPDDLDRYGGLTASVVNRLLDKGLAAITGAFVCVFDSGMAPVLMLCAQGVGRPAIDLFRSNIRCASLLASGCTFALGERPFECAAIVPSTAECKLSGTIHMEDLWTQHQEVLRQVVTRRAGISWLEEFRRQLYDARHHDAFIKNARNLVETRGMATSDEEIRLIIEMASMM